MSHPEQVGFFRAVRQSNEPFVVGSHVLEIGSYDVNGTIRDLFADAATYVGVDLEPGPGVDRVAFGHEVGDPDGTYDVTLSGECFEHDMHWRDTFANMVRLTRPGGLVAFTCASRGRVEHGTVRSEAALSPGTRAVGLDHYRNLTSADFDDLPLDEWFSEHQFWYIPTHCDLYFAGVRRGEERSKAMLPNHATVMALKTVMSTPKRIVRLPNRLLAQTPLSEERFQDALVPYWTCLLRLGGWARAKF